MGQKTPIYQVWISTDCTNNARKKHQLHKLSLWKVALSSRYKCITSHQLHCIAAPLLWHFVWLDVQQMCCSGEPSTFISADGTYLLVQLPEMIGKVQIYVHLVTFQIHWKENYLNWIPSSSSEIYLLLTPLPLGISMTVHGEGIWIFFSTTQCERNSYTVPHCIYFVYF